MKLLALDLGTKTGWAWHDGQLCNSGTRIHRHTKKHHPGHVYRIYHAWLESLLDSLLPDVVYYEKVRRHLGTDAAHMYGGYQAILLALCAERDIRVEGVPVQTIKKHATGKGNAKKEIIVALIKSLGYEPCDDNEADALALLNYARSVEE